MDECIILITNSVLKPQQPSKQWILEKKCINHIGLIRDMMTDDIQMTQLYFDNIDDDTFAYIYKMLTLDNHKLSKYINIIDSSFHIRILYRLYVICDYLNIENLQKYLGHCLSSKFNKMTYEELEYTINSLFYE